MERFVPRDRKSPDVQTAEVSEDEISCADPDPQPLIPRDGLSIIAASFAGGQTKAGVDLGPSALLNNEFNLLNHLSKTWHIQQTSLSPHSFPPSPIIHHSGMSNLRLVSNYTHQLALQAYTHVRNNRTLLTLGGDHSLAIGSIAGVAKAMREATGAALGVVWVDAHADINTPESSPSGNVHGMPVAFLTGIARGAERPLSDGSSNRNAPFDWMEDMHRVDLGKLVYIGLRDVDEAETKILQQCGAKVYGMADVETHGIASIMSRALEYLGPKTPLHLSFDIDALDPAIAPSTGTPVPRGLSLWEGRYVASELAKTERLVAMDLVEVNPLENMEGNGPKKTVEAACQIIEAALGKRSYV